MSLEPVADRVIRRDVLPRGRAAGDAGGRGACGRGGRCAHPGRCEARDVDGAEPDEASHPRPRRSRGPGRGRRPGRAAVGRGLGLVPVEARHAVGRAGSRSAPTRQPATATPASRRRATGRWAACDRARRRRTSTAEALPAASTARKRRLVRPSSVTSVVSPAVVGAPRRPAVRRDLVLVVVEAGKRRRSSRSRWRSPRRPTASRGSDRTPTARTAPCGRAAPSPAPTRRSGRHRPPPGSARRSRPRSVTDAAAPEVADDQVEPPSVEVSYS